MVPANGGISLGVVAPDGRDGMVAHAEQFAAAGIPWLFDPGQGLPMFDGAELRAFIDKATWVAVNDYEGQLLQERTGLSCRGRSPRACRPISSPRAPKAASIHAGGREYDDPDGAAEAVKDPDRVRRCLSRRAHFRAHE